MVSFFGKNNDQLQYGEGATLIALLNMLMNLDGY